MYADDTTICYASDNIAELNAIVLLSMQNLQVSEDGFKGINCL